MKTIKKIDILFILLIFLFAITSRYIFSAESGNYFGIDPSYFALGAEDYSIINDRPHLPGYFLHIESIKLLTAFTGDRSISMILLSIFYSSLAAIFVYMILRKWFNTVISLSFSFLLITNPLVWFYGCVPEIYTFDMFFSSAIILCGLSGRMIFLAPVLLAIGTGVRQSSGVLILPIYFFLWINYYRNNKTDKRLILIIHIVAVILILIWFIPMANSAGGLGEYISLYRTHNPMQGKAALLGIRQFLINQISIVSFCYTIILSLIYPILKLFISSKRLTNNDLINSKDKILLKICFWWIVPIIIFFIFYHYNKGYILIIIPGILLLLAYLIKRTNISGLYITSITVIQILYFIFFPYVKTSDEVCFSPDKRSISKYDVWLERLQGPYSMSYGRIKESNKRLKTIKSGISFCNKKLSEYTYNGYFISATAGVVPNVLNLFYPRARIYFIQRGHQDKYYECFGININERHGFANMIKYDVIITSGSFYEKYLSNFCKPIYKNGDIIFSVIVNGQQEKISKLYLELF